MTSAARTIPSSKYLKAAQQLLDEVVNVRKALKQPDKEKNQNTNEHGTNSSKEGDGKLQDGSFNLRNQPIMCQMSFLTLEDKNCRIS